MAPLSTAELDALAATDVREAIPPAALLPALTSPPFIPTRSLINLRDVGAVPGSAVPPRRFYRSGVMDAAAADLDALARPWAGQTTLPPSTRHGVMNAPESPLPPARSTSPPSATKSWSGTAAG